jgi:hypothetical protein
MVALVNQASGVKLRSVTRFACTHSGGTVCPSRVRSMRVRLSRQLARRRVVILERLCVSLGMG